MGPEHSCTVLISMPEMQSPDILYLGRLSELYLHQTTLRDEVMPPPGQITGLLTCHKSHRVPKLSVLLPLLQHTALAGIH